MIFKVEGWTTNHQILIGFLSEFCIDALLIHFVKYWEVHPWKARKILQHLWLIQHRHQEKTIGTLNRLIIILHRHIREVCNEPDRTSKVYWEGIIVLCVINYQSVSSSKVSNLKNSQISFPCSLFLSLDFLALQTKGNEELICRIHLHMFKIRACSTFNGRIIKTFPVSIWDYVLQIIFEGIANEVKWSVDQVHF